MSSDLANLGFPEVSKQSHHLINAKVSGAVMSMFVLQSIEFTTNANFSFLFTEQQTDPPNICSGAWAPRSKLL